MAPDPGSGEFDAKESRLNNPSGWMQLTRYETVRLLVDALLESPPGHQFNKSELERRTGVSRESIREHLPFLVELGVVKEVNSGEWPEYQLNDDGKVTQELFELSSAVNSVLGGGPKNVERTPRMEVSESDDDSSERQDTLPESVKDVDNARRDARNDELIDQPPKRLGVNAD